MCGRTIFEMLSVLVIAGILSLGALTGFQYALHRQKAIDILDDIRLFALTVQTDNLLDQLQYGQTHSGSDTLFIANTSSTYLLTKEREDSFYITAVNIPAKVCDQLLNFQPEFVEEIVANKGLGCRYDENDVQFYMNTLLNKEISNKNRYKSCEKDEDCTGACSICQDNRCADDDELCSSASPFCIKGSCQTCPKDQVLSSTGLCVDCYSTAQTIHSATSSCDACSNRFGFNNNQCILCSSPDPYWLTKENCLNCPNRYYPSETQASYYCYLCIGTVTEQKNDCIWNCPKNEFGAQGKCYSCASPLELETNETSCNSCPYRYLNTSKKCVLCDDETISWATLEQCHRCPNRYLYGGTAQGYCSLCIGTTTDDGLTCLWDCPKGQMGNGSSCQDCKAYGEVVNNSSALECSKCPGRFFGSYYYQNNACFVCEVSFETHTTSEQCARCPQRYYSNGACRLCPDNITDLTVQAECEACHGHWEKDACTN